MENYLLKLADDTLIMGQRLAEWCGKGPYLEEDIALTNISLDYLGQASSFYQYAARLAGGEVTEDSLAMLRLEHQYLNAQLVEMPNGDYAQTILKVYLFSLYQRNLYTQMIASSNIELAGIAEKSLKEVKYHQTHSYTWMKVFSHGTEESRNRLLEAIDFIWPYTGGLFDQVKNEQKLVEEGIAVDPEKLKAEWTAQLKADFNEFGLQITEDPFMHKGSRQGIHTEYFGYILCELQYMQRAYPGCSW